MKALRINDYGAPLHLDEVPVPTAGPGQVLVENDFTSLNGVDPRARSRFLAPGLSIAVSMDPGWRCRRAGGGHRRRSHSLQSGR